MTTKQQQETCACPRCGQLMTGVWAMRGTSPHYYLDYARRCTNFEGCLLAGLPIWETNNSKKLERLATIQRNNKYRQRNYPNAK